MRLKRWVHNNIMMYFLDCSYVENLISALRLHLNSELPAHRM